MFDFIIEGVRYLGWILYAGMCYLISSIYETLLAIPNVLSQVLGNDSVDNLFNSMRALFFIFAGLMIVTIVLVRLFDWNVSKMMNQVKKVFLLSLVLIGMPWFITTAENITNALISSGSNVMTSELGESNNTDFGVSLANIYIYKNERYKGAEDYDEADDSPFNNVGDITDSNIINTKIENEDGDEVYVYSYLNPILGIILNLVIMGLLIFANLKVYGYVYQIVILKVWTPLKAIKDGFDDTPISELFGDFVTAFLSLAIQIVIVPFSLIMMNVLVAIDGINLFEQIGVILVGLYYMVFGIDYIQNKFMVESGVPSVFEVYAYSQVGKNIAEGVGNAASGVGNMFEKIRSSGEGDNLIDTGRESDINNMSDIKDIDDLNKDEDVVNDNENDISENDANDIDDSIENMNDVDSQIDEDVDSQIDEDIDSQIDEDIDSLADEDIDVVEDVDNQLDESNDITEDIDVNDDINNEGEKFANQSDLETVDYTEDNQSNNDKVITDEKPGVDNKIDSDSEIKNEVPEAIRPTDKQTRLAESMGIDVSGKDKYQIGQEIETHIKNKNDSSKSNFVEPTYEKPDDSQLDSKFESKLDNIIKGGW